MANTNKKKNTKKSKKKQTVKMKTTSRKSTSTKKKVSKKKTSNKKTTSSSIKKQTKKSNPNKKTVKPKKTLNLFLYLSVIVILSIIFLIYNNLLLAPTPFIKDVNLDNDTVNVKVSNKLLNLNNNIYCLYSETDTYPSVNDNRWELSNNNTCSYKIDNTFYYIFIKNEDNKIIKVNTDNIGFIKNISISNKKVYLPLKSKYNYTLSYDKYGSVDETIKWTSKNDNIASIDSNGIVYGKSNGNTIITVKIGDYEVSSEVIVTNLITTRPSKGYDYKKPYLPCNKYSKEENDLIDEILKDKIENVGYKTRAGVVEAARFLTLDFPYRINYFYENGRQTTNNVDGEGRYYHVGFYLNKSRYKNITGSKKGPKTWGCSLYSSPAHRKINNGLDCSGFVSWALLNGGFNVKDVGAGWSNNRDLTDYGEVKKLTTTLSTSNKIKVGDLLHSERAGGHIGIIVGIDKDNYYVAQAIWYDTIGVIITKHKKNKLNKSFPHVVLMDKYYKNDGNLTNMW